MSVKRGCSVRSNIGPSAKPSAGSAKAAEAMPPAASAPPVNSPRRVTVSPSYAPGMPRSTVYGDFRLWGGLDGSATRTAHDIAGTWRGAAKSAPDAEWELFRPVLVRQRARRLLPQLVRRAPFGIGPRAGGAQVRQHPTRLQAALGRRTARAA